ncbi:MAG TPA: lipoprotein [Thiomonas arsenitoxydans]|uniref:LPS translocon maturation chaperone LptM n=1 Tax=Thiomonas sp. TaxID=2047785 RepID=UPI0009D66C2E|nr:lipoprotein [Thiomonas sp.]HOI65020.1 lipoprotein [Thiomonas arsenitoxydans]
MDRQLNRPHHLRPLLRLMAALGVVVLLGGCGQTGPLYLPTPAPAHSASAAPR